MADESKPVFADLKTVKQLAQEMSSEHLRCRRFGHNWRINTPEILSSADQKRLHAYYSESMTCSVCKTVRRQLLAKSGSLRSNSYAYAKGYQTPKGTGRLSGKARDVLRQTDILRRLSQAR